jgi:Uma2 family endonuclease
VTIAQSTPILTPDDLLRMPDSGSMELVNGQIVEKQGSAESSEIEGLFFFQFHSFLQGNPVAKVYPQSLGYQCFKTDPNKIRKPDATVILLDRLRKLPDPNPGFMPIVPDLAVEVISPNDMVYDVDEKVREYLDAGFPLVWVADPKARTITVHLRSGRPVIHTADDDLTADPPLPGFRCKVADFFPPAPPK